MADLKVLAWNCGGLRATVASQPKVMFFEKEFGSDFDIFFFVETHHKQASEIPEQILRYKDTFHIVHSPVGEHETHAGIIGLVSKEYDVINTIHHIQGRLVSIRLQHSVQKTIHNISAVYLYTNNNITRNSFQTIANKLRFEHNDEESHMILGDFNFIDHAKDKSKGLGNNDKMILKIWQPFLDEHDMVDPFRVQNPNRRFWSFIGTGVAGNSRIDRLYIDSTRMHKVHNFSYIQTPFKGHRILSFTVK